MNQKERVQELAVLRRQGMMKHNTQIIAEGWKSEDFLCERESTGPKVTCSGCNGVFKKSLYYKHAKACQADGTAPRPTVIAASTTPSIPASEWDTV